MGLKLSHTQLESYRTCAQKYNLHYNERLRETFLNSPLFLGSALDSALNAILNRKLKGVTKIENPFQVFSDKMLTTELNGSKVHIPTFRDVNYNKGDFEPRLLLSDDYLGINEKFPDFEITPDTITPFVEEIRERQKTSAIPEDERILFNYINWSCLKRKGELLIQAYEEQIFPHITAVHTIQEPVSLINEEGDSVVGFIDFVGDWDGVGPIVLDNKSSSRKYKEDAVHESEQLCLYAEHKEINKAGFIVLIKDVKFVEHKTCQKCGDKTTRKFKTCQLCQGDFKSEFVPKVDTQVLINDLNNTNQEKIFLEIEGITSAIKSKLFHKNLNNCWGFGRKCEYFEYCRNGSMENLIRLVDKRKKPR